MTGEGTHRWEAAHFCKDDVGLASKGAQVSLEANAHVVRSPAQRVGEGQLTTDSFEDMEDTGDSCIIDPHRVRRKLGEPHMRVEEGRPEHSCGGPVVVAHILCPAVAARASGHRATDGCDDDWVGLAVTRQPPLQPLKCVHGSRRPSQLDATLDEWDRQRRAAGCAHVREARSASRGTLCCRACPCSCSTRRDRPCFQCDTEPSSRKGGAAKKRRRRRALAGSAGVRCPWTWLSCC